MPVTPSSPGIPESRASIATRFEDIAARNLEHAGNPEAIAVAQAAATLALTQRVASLTEKLEHGVDGIEGALRG